MNNPFLRHRCRNQPKPARAPAGFTLIELLVTTAITGVTLVALLGVFSWTARVNRLARHTALGYEIANQEIELLRATPFGNLPANQTEGALVGTIEGLDSLPAAAGFLTIENYPQGDTSGTIRAVSVRVEWSEGTATRQVQVDTLIAQGGINP